MDGRTRSALTVSTVVIASVLLLSSSFLFWQSYATSDLPSWEFKGAYANYTIIVYEGTINLRTVNGTTNITLMRYHNAGSTIWQIHSVGIGTYSYSQNSYPFLPSLPPHMKYVTSLWNSSSMLSIGQKSFPTPIGISAINASVLKGLGSNETDFWYWELPVVPLAGVSHVMYLYNGSETEAIRCVIFLNSTGSDYTAYEKLTLFFSATNGLMLNMSQNSVSHATINSSTKQINYQNYSYKLYSTNVPFDGSSTRFRGLPYSLVILIVAAVAVIAAVFVTVIKKRKVSDKTQLQRK